MATLPSVPVPPPPHVKSSLSKIISQRRKEAQEEARRKLAADLEEIRNSSTNDARKDALKILPREIWRIVLDYLTEPKDIKNAQSTCILFKELLRKQYFSKVLFPKVFSVQPFRRIFEGGSSFNHVTSEIVKLRSVSKEWRDGVDAYFEEDLQNSWAISPDSIYREQCLGIGCLGVLRPYGDEGQRVIDRVLADLNAEGLDRMVNPKPFQRSVSVDLGNVSFYHGKDEDALVHGELQMVFKKVTKLLKAVGSQILEFTVGWGGDGGCKTCVGQVYFMLCEWVKRLPELRNLRVLISFGDVTDLDPHDVQTVIEAFPFPTLPQLVCFDVDFSSSQADDWLQVGILKSNSHIKYLTTVTTEDFVAGEALIDRVQHLPQVEFMRLDFEDSNSVEIFPIVMNRTWPLRGLQITAVGQIAVPRLFRFLENFQTLQCLEIAKVIFGGKGGDPGFLKLPNLTHLDFVFGVWPDFPWLYDVVNFRRYLFNANFTGPDESDIDSDPYESEDEDDSDDDKDRKKRRQVFILKRKTFPKYSIDFLFPMKKLETLVWRSVNSRLKPEIINDDRKWDHEIIKFRGGQMDLYKSNIWDVFPKLKRIEVEYDGQYPYAFRVRTAFLGGRTIFRRNYRGENLELKQDDEELPDNDDLESLSDSVSDLF